MYEILMVVYLVVALALIGFILIQQGKGAGMGSSFGSGASGTVFGASGSGNFLTKATTILAIIFFGVALGLGNLTSEKTAAPDDDSLFSSDGTEKVAVPVIPQGGAVDLPVGDLPVETTTEAVTTEAATDLPLEGPAAEPKKDDGSN